jgi:hypothetical protein
MTEPSKDLVVQSTAYSRASLEERQRYVAALAKAGDLLPPNYRGGMVRNPDTNQMVQIGSAGKIMLMAETGDMLGIHPMAALVGVHIIEGKPSLSANLMNGLVRKAGHTLRVRVTGKLEDETLEAHATLIRSDDPDFPFEVTWTLEDAKRAGLYPGKTGSNWQKYPRAMLKSRVISEIIREGAADVLMGGNVYTPEELGAQVNEQGEPIDLTEVRDDPPQGGAPRRDGEGFEAAPAQPETPIVDDRPAEPQDEATDWAKEIANASSKAEMGAIFQKAKRLGVLGTKIVVGKTERVLGDVIVEVGRAMADAEEAVAEGTVEPDVADQGEPAVLDPDVVDAEIVEETPSAS